jgi:hypothetical protein
MMIFMFMVIYHGAERRERRAVEANLFKIFYKVIDCHHKKSYDRHKYGV